MPLLKNALAGVLGSTVALTGLTLALPAAPAQAVGGVFISEIHYDNASTDTGEFVEITAPAGTDLSAYSIVRYNGTTPSAATVYTSPAASNALTGTVADQADGWGTGVVNYPTDGLQNGGNDGVALVHNGTLVEFLTWEGGATGSGGPANGVTSTDIGVSQTSAPAGQTLQRQVDGTWTGPVENTKGVPNGYDGGGTGGELAATVEPDVEVTVDEAMTPVVLQAAGGTPPYTWTTESDLPAGTELSADGEITGTPTEVGAFPITAVVTDDEGATDDVSFTLAVKDPAAPTTIADIQGTGAATPMANQTVTTRGVVTATYPTGGFNGFYLQTPGPDTTPNASDGIFVYGPSFDESTLDPGDSVEVTGVAKEFGTLTEIEATAVTEVADLGDVVPKTVIPGTDCALPGTGCLSGAALEAAREKSEGEAFQPTGAFTVTDVYDGSAYNPPQSINNNFVGEIGLAANSTIPLIAPTEIIDAQATSAIAARTAYNNAHRVVLDDGSSTTYWNTSNDASGQDTPFPYYTPDHQVRVGADVTFDQPVILDFRFGWKVQPVEQVVEEPTGLVTFEQDRPSAPEEVAGDIKLATFNVLNYFTTLGEDLAGCQPYRDRDENPIAVRTGCDARGAWTEASFARQEAKIVNAINALDADVIALEEIENSLVVDGHDRDEALSTLVDALNEDAGAGTWDYVESPASASLPGNIAEQDVIRQGMIYKPATVETVGAADMLFDEPAFDNAREPFAAVFKPLGGTADEEFLVIANHFKSKGSGINDGTGQGNANPDRIAQAEALAEYADDLAAARGVEAVFLTGDFNAYSQEDPMQVLYGAGYENLAPEGEWSYNFDGQVGSLDHVLGNAAATEQVAGVDIWEINSNETVFNQYSRYNYNAAQLYSEAPFSASDHNPEIVGIGIPDTTVDATVTGSDVTVVHGSAASMHVTVSTDGGPVPTGEVTVTSGGNPIGSATLVGGEADVAITPGSLPVGTSTVTISYSGDEAVNPATGTATITVTEAPASATVTAAPVTVVYGKPAIMVVKVTAPDGVVPKGRVVLTSGGVTLGSKALGRGQARVPIPPKKLPAGVHTVTIAYSGDANVPPATGTSTLTVQKATPTVRGTNVTQKLGRTAVMRVRVAAPNVKATGTVTVERGDTVLGTANLNANGIANVTIPKNVLPVAATPYSVTITYEGDDNVKSGTGTATVRVRK